MASQRSPEVPLENSDGRRRGFCMRLSLFPFFKFVFLYMRHVVLFRSHPSSWCICSVRSEAAYDDAMAVETNCYGETIMQATLFGLLWSAAPQIRLPKRVSKCFSGNGDLKFALLVTLA